MFKVGDKVKVKKNLENAGSLYNEYMGREGVVITATGQKPRYFRVSFSLDIDLNQSLGHEYVDMGGWRLEKS